MLIIAYTIADTEIMSKLAAKQDFVLIDSDLFCAIIIIEDSGVTSYRGDDAIACVGMQPVVEPALGLWDNLKPNRFFGAERKRFSRILHLQDPLVFHF